MADTFVSQFFGDDSNDGLSVANAKKTILAGAGAASNNATVTVYPGIYKESVQVPNSNGMKFVAVGKAILDGEHKLTYGFLGVISTQIEIDGFEIKNYGEAIRDENASSSIPSIIINNTIHNCSRGIISRNSNSTKIYNFNTIYDIALTAIQDRATSAVVNHNKNTIYNCPTGIHFPSTNNANAAIITDNIFSQCETAIYAVNSGTFGTLNNNVYDVAAGNFFGSIGGSTQTTFSGWQTASDSEASGKSGDPSFANKEKGIFSLLTNSIAQSGAASGSYIGAHLTEVGWFDEATFASGAVLSAGVEFANIVGVGCSGVILRREVVTESTSPIVETSGTGNDENTITLLHMQGTSGVSGFLDSSSLFHNVTVEGTPIIDTGESKFGGSSAKFSASGDAIVLKDRDSAGSTFRNVFQYGIVGLNSTDITNYDHTIDFWTMFTNAAGSGIPYSHSEGVSDEYTVSVSTSKIIIVEKPNSIVSTTNISLSIDTWYHIAVSVDSTAQEIYVFVDGVLQNTIDISGVSQTAVFSSNNASVKIKPQQTASGVVYLDEYRITRGTARWTSGFNIPTQEYGEQSSQGADGGGGTTLALFHFDAVDSDTGSGVFKDYGPNAFETKIVADDVQGHAESGNPMFGRTCFKIDGTSADDDGAIEILDSSSAWDFHLSGTDFTMECWVNTEGNTANIDLYQQRDDANNVVFWNISSTIMTFRIVDATVTEVNFTSTLSDGSPDRWTHLAITRVGTTYRAFQDGQLLATLVDADAAAAGYTANPRLMANHSAVVHLMDEFRIVTGTGLYTVDFTPQYAPYGIVASGNDSNTMLLINGKNDIGGSTTIIDTSVGGVGSPHTITPSGGAKITQDIGIFGDNAIEFAASGGLVMSDSADFDFGSGDITVDCWIRLNNINNVNYLFEQFDDSSTEWSFFYFHGINRLRVTEGTSTISSSNITLESGVWYHVAFERSGDDVRLYLDGVSLGGGTKSGAWSNPTSDLIVGGSISNPGSGIDGYMDEIRISKFARYGGLAATNTFPIVGQSYGVSSGEVFTAGGVTSTSVSGLTPSGTIELGIIDMGVSRNVQNILDGFAEDFTNILIDTDLTDNAATSGEVTLEFRLSDSATGITGVAYTEYDMRTDIASGTFEDRFMQAKLTLHRNV